MAYGIALRAWGRYACFTRPEMKVERVSYDVMTPSAARGILEAIYWKPCIRWRIERIHVLSPIRFTNIRRNEVASKIPVGNIRQAMRDPVSPLHVFVEDDRQQRAAMVLEDVDYVIEASFDITEIAGTRRSDGAADSNDQGANQASRDLPSTSRGRAVLSPPVFRHTRVPRQLRVD